MPEKLTRPKIPNADEKVEKDNDRIATARILPTAKPTRLKQRHWILAFSFLVLVILPSFVVGVYLYKIAVDQYSSTVGFSVRSENTNPAVELLGGITELSTSSSSDTDILYEYIQSQELVAKLDKWLDLRAIFSKPENDPYFSFDPELPIEDLVAYWKRMVKIYYDSGTKLIELRVLAFDEQDAQDIAFAIFDESSNLINELSAIARDDTIKYAKSELEIAVDRLKDARQQLTKFRNRTQFIDPSQGASGQQNILDSLRNQLSEALIDLDLLKESTLISDPRIIQAQLKINVISARIIEEQKKIGLVGEHGGSKMADLVGEYESLAVDLEFAEQAYIAALSSYNVAIAEAQRKSRYLAAFVKPTLAESSEYPQRFTLLGLTSLFLVIGWGILMLFYYSLRDRR